jgi:hypothetical protein
LGKLQLKLAIYLLVFTFGSDVIELPASLKVNKNDKNNFKKAISRSEVRVFRHGMCGENHCCQFSARQCAAYSGAGDPKSIQQRLGVQGDGRLHAGGCKKASSVAEQPALGAERCAGRSG